MSAVQLQAWDGDRTDRCVDIQGEVSDSPGPGIILFGKVESAVAIFALEYPSEHIGGTDSVSGAVALHHCIVEALADTSKQRYQLVLLVLIANLASLTYGRIVIVRSVYLVMLGKSNG